MIEKAYAKINLYLDVYSKRDDNYHNLKMIMVPLKLHDSLEINVLNNAVDDFVTCDDFSLTINKYNLCHTTIDLARKKWGFKEHFRVHIHKNIFLQAGLGGGSADAAATLRGIVKLLKLDVKQEELIEMASQIGSDVPWAIENKPCIVESKGEILKPFEINKRYFVLLVKPKQGLSTQVVFHKCDELGYEYKDRIDIVKQNLIDGDLEELSKNIFNGLEDSAIALLSEIKDIKDKLKEDGMEVVQMSGAGSTVFALSNDLKKCKRLLVKYINQGYDVELTSLL